MKNIAVITARSGSKGLKDKNIRPLCGKPLMWYSVSAALKSGKFDTVMVSTDSAAYAEIAKECGAEVPFIRSSENSADTASSWDTVREVLENYSAWGKNFDTVCLLQPTSPLRTAEDIVNGYALLDELSADAIVSVCRLEHSINYVNKLPEDKSLVDFLRSNKYARQMNEPYYRFNGALYITRVPAFLERNDIFKGNCFAYIMDKRSSVDIDDEIDFLECETLLKYFEQQGK